mgnify:CR=1 FL=1|tara:strand:+ start:3885 stop:7388 length:3504 start_codon:yes stop_codon:yes gene_type:complete
MIWRLNSLGTRIGLGFMVMAFLIAITVYVTILMVGTLETTNERIIKLRVPTNQASTDLLNGIHRSSAAIRGWILTSDSSFLIERDDVWKNQIFPTFNQLERLSLDWTNPKNKELLDMLRPMLNNLKGLQDNIDNKAKDTQILFLNSSLIPRVNEITEILNEMANDQRLLMDTDLMDSKAQVVRMEKIEWVILGSGILISLLLGTIITRSITSPVSKAVNVARSIGSGNLSVPIDIHGTTEIKALGMALTEMRDELQRKINETELYEWNTRGKNILYETIRGDKDLVTLSNDIVSCIAEYTRCQSAALYLFDETHKRLVLHGKYCIESTQLLSSFTLGEGLVGQVAKDKKTILLDLPDDDHLKIQSSIISHRPKHVYVVPFLFDGQTIGVLELARSVQFDEPIKDYIDSIQESLGITYNAAIAQQKIKELLEETQQQSEELQQQTEELEQSNEELEEQTQKLKEQQEELQVANEELEEQSQLVEQKNQALETARSDIELKARQLEVSSKYKSEFLANMSHELRTPLNSLLILANDLADNKDKNLNEEQIESAKIISNSGYDLLNLINEILDLSKIEAGRMDLNLENVYFDEVASNIQRSFKRNAEAKSIEFEVKLEDNLPSFFLSDKQRLEQVLKNLISNAIKFTEKGKVSVIIASDINEQVAFTIKDTGIGIPLEKQDIIFEAFQQAEGGTSRKYGGTGLGLSISRELVKLLGGSISLVSMPGEGSSFTITLPFELKTNQELKKIPEQRIKKVDFKSQEQFVGYPSLDDQREEINEGDRVVLIIEDDSEFAKILAGMANDKGFKYLTASTGEDGLILASKYLPSAIILDLELPGINGHMVLKELKGNPDLRHIPVHIMSASDQTLDPIRAGAVEFLSKPVNKDKLGEAFGRIEEFISRKMKNLLVIEDNKDLRKSIIKLIGNGDVHCIEAGTAGEALDHFGKHTIDCIVLDIGLPDMSGFDLIKRFESTNGGLIPPVIVYTGKDLTKEESDALQEHAETVIIKGVKSDERLLDETALFLHRTVQNLPASKKQMITSMYDKETIFIDKKVLIVDDDMRNVFALSKVLKEKGLEIIKADNGKTALKSLNEDKNIDIVLMDIMMPEMDGYECMKEIRKVRHFKELPIIALTAKAMKEDRKKCIDAGADDYITKPVDIDRLLSLMRIWIKK